MTIARYGALVLFGLVGSLAAQQAGMQNEWDIHKTLTAIALHADRLVPFLDQIHPESWTQAGAPAAYTQQAKTCQNEIRGIAQSARELSRNPEKLTDEMKLLFRIRTFETLLASLGEGLRKYQNPPMADMLSSAVAENSPNRERLQEYVMELAIAREQEFRVADQEAQRCRESISRRPSTQEKH